VVLVLVLAGCSVGAEAGVNGPLLGK